ncbi:MAG: hypothetical protein ACTTJ1_07440 [Treponema sp.]
MKTKRFFYVFLAAVLFAFISCNQNDDDGGGEVIDYPFETLYGSWTRTGGIGAMGIAKLKVYKDENDDTITLMDFGSDKIESKTYKCYITKQSPAVYKVVWKTFDKATKTEGAEEPPVTITVDSENEIYLNRAGMGNMPMKRD